MNSSNSSTSYHPMTDYTFPENDINLEQDEDPYYRTMFNFPNSPHIHLEYQDAYLQFLELFHQHQSSDHHHHTISAVDHDQDAAGNAQTMIPSTVDDINQASRVAPKKKYSKKDRHSKINTARGPRDRRMRLSLDVARKFFDLQDMLEYGKASQTVEWLLNNSKSAIKELQRSRGSVCSASSPSADGCDVVSSSIHQSTTVGSDQEPPASSSCTKIKRIKKIIKVGRASVSRESRTKARERARERTSQKRRRVSQINDKSTSY